MFQRNTFGWLQMIMRAALARERVGRLWGRIVLLKWQYNMLLLLPLHNQPELSIQLQVRLSVLWYSTHSRKRCCSIWANECCYSHLWERKRPHVQAFLRHKQRNWSRGWGAGGRRVVFSWLQKASWNEWGSCLWRWTPAVCPQVRTDVWKGWEPSKNSPSWYWKRFNVYLYILRNNNLICTCMYIVTTLSGCAAPGERLRGGHVIEYC